MITIYLITKNESGNSVNMFSLLIRIYIDKNRIEYVTLCVSFNFFFDIFVKNIGQISYIS